MNKLQSARDFLLASPLDIRADKLLTFAEEGAVTRYRADGPASFSISYTAHLIVTDYTGQPADLLFVMLDWMDRHAPNTSPDALKFHADIIDHKRADVSLKIDLVDVIRATTTDAGTTLSGQDDPDALGMDMTHLVPGLA